MASGGHIRAFRAWTWPALVCALILWLLLAPEAHGAGIAVRGSTPGNNGAGSTTLTLTLPAGVQQGDLLLAQVTVATGGAATTITVPTGWSQVLTTTSGTGAIQVIQRVYRKRATTEPASYNWGFSAARVASGGITALLGANSNNPIAGSNGANGNCAAAPCLAASGTVATTGPLDWVTGAYGIGSAAAWTAAPGLSGLYNSTASGGASSHGAAAVAGASSVGPFTATAGGTGRWVAQLVAVRVDATLPTASLTNPAAVLKGAVTLTGNGTDAGSGVASVAFEISPSGLSSWTPVAAVTAAPYTTSFDTTSVPDGLYDFRTIATDWAGNASTPAVRTARRIDNTAPSLSFTNPGATLTGSVPLTATATDGGSGVASVRFEYAPAGTGVFTLIRNDTSSPYTATFATAGLADGLYDLRAVATDAAGNVQTVVHASRVIDNSVPTVALVDPGAALSGALTLSATAGDAASGIATVAFAIKPSAGSVWTSLGTDGMSPYQAALGTTSFSDGLYDLRAVATDNVGKTATSTLTGRRIDNAAPAVSLANPGSVLHGTVPLAASASDGGSGIATVTFEVAPAGSGSWIPVGVATAAPYSVNLDTSALADGAYDLRAVARDRAGNQTASTLAGRLVDNTAPVTSDDAPSGWSNQAVTVSLSATDSGSGVAWTQFSLDGGAFQAGTQVVVAAPVDGSNDGIHVIAYRSADLAGNVEADRTATVRIDTTSPIVSLADPGGLLRGGVTLDATASDAASGVTSVAFEVSAAGGNSWQAIGADGTAPYGTLFDTSSVDDGAYDLRAVATDLAGNQAVSALVAGVVVDNTAPVTSDDAPSGWSNQAVTVSLSATDSGSGVAWTQFSLDGGAFQAGTQAVVAAPVDGSNDGIHVIAYRSADLAGNVEADRTATVRIDTTSPFVSLADPGTPVAGILSLTASASDAGSGLAQVAFERWAPGGWQTIATDTGAPYAADFDTTSVADGAYDFRAVATDAAGNQAVSPVIAGVVVDNSPPQTTDDAPRGWSNQPVTVSLVAADAGSGVAAIAYSLDGGPFQAGTQVVVGAPADGSNDGIHTIVYRSTDLLGNVESDRTATVRIDATAPVVSLGEPIGLLAAGVALNASASDDSSGVVSVEFQRTEAGESDWQTIANDLEAPWETQLDGVAPGSYDLRAVASDAAGNKSASSLVALDVGAGPTTGPLRLRLLRARLVAQGGNPFLSLRLQLSEEAGLRATLRDGRGHNLRSWQLQGKAGTRTVLLRLPVRYPRDRRCTLIVRASVGGKSVEQRLTLQLR